MTMKLLKTFEIILLLFAITLSIHGQESTAIVSTPPSSQLIHFGDNGNGECTAKYREYPNSYLRFVARPHHTNFLSSYMDCFRRCCASASFLCKSFSYFWQTRQCFLMNVTQHDEGVVLAPSKVHVHIELDGYNRTRDVSAIAPTASIEQPEEIPEDDPEEIKFDEKDNSESEVEEVSPTESSKQSQPVEQKGFGTEDSDEALTSGNESPRVYPTSPTGDKGGGGTPSYNSGSGSDITAENKIAGDKQSVSSDVNILPTLVTVGSDYPKTTNRLSTFSQRENQQPNYVSETESSTVETTPVSAITAVSENRNPSSLDASQPTKSLPPGRATTAVTKAMSAYTPTSANPPIDSQDSSAPTVKFDGSPSQRPTTQTTTRKLTTFTTKASTPKSNLAPSTETQRSTKHPSPMPPTDQKSATYKGTGSRLTTPRSRFPSTNATTQQPKTNSAANISTVKTPTTKLSGTSAKTIALGTIMTESSTTTQRPITTLIVLPTNSTAAKSSLQKVPEPTITRSTAPKVLQRTTLPMRPTVSQSSQFKVTSLPTSNENAGAQTRSETSSITPTRFTVRSIPTHSLASTVENTASSQTKSSRTTTPRKLPTTTTSPSNDISISSPAESSIIRSKKPSEVAEPSVTKRTDDAKSKTSRPPLTSSRRPGSPTATGKVSIVSTFRQKVVSCNLKCHNGGTCVVEITIDSASKIESCQCVNGFRGDKCELLPPVSGGGFAWWVIALIVLAVVFLVCAIGVYASYLIYRRRNMIGKYNVARERRFEARSLDTLDDFDKMASYSTLGWYERPRRNSWRSSGTFSTAASV